ncbi:cation-translocating P-type ATPase [Schaalia sp. Marseille-Q2122]|uniref:cation-translocating P-type ATPase n=1 Tax=Schaalia sp. Marseille-Q2122 TaxID=2736604 RepID=UPI00158BD5E6|nr:cation-translocating P-type ATPase [Schaalia sp. Marseille-Q2122]
METPASPRATAEPPPHPRARAATATSTPEASAREHLANEAHARSGAELATELSTDAASGLASTEAAARLKADGPNELPSSRPPAWLRFLHQFKDPLVFLLIGAIVISVIAWVIEGARGVPVDGIVIFLVIFLNAVLGFIQENKAADAVAALSAMTAATSTVLRDGARTLIPSSELVVGDILVLSEGDQVGADARLLKAAALRAIESSLTGEADAVAKHTAAVPLDTDLADRSGMVYCGTSIAQGSGEAIVVATGARTQMGEIALMLDEVEEEPTPLQREIHQISTVLGGLVVLIAVGVVATLLLLSPDRSIHTIIDSLLLGVSLAVAAVPEGLPAILSVVLALGVQRMALHKAVVKKLTSVETLGSASVIASDKTGTLTRSEMTIQEVATASGVTLVSGSGYTPEGSLAPDADRDGQPDATPLSESLAEEVRYVLSGGAMASDAQLDQDEGVWSVIGDPTEGAFLVAERKLGAQPLPHQGKRRVWDFPFTSERKLMSVIYEAEDHSMVLVAKGAPDVLIERCVRVRRDGHEEALTDAWRATFLEHVSDMSGRALRTLAVAYRPLGEDEAARVRAAMRAQDGWNGGAEDTDLSLESQAPDPADLADLEGELTMAGVVGIIDPPRPEAADAVAEARRAGVRVLMITGDHPATAGRIAADLGIHEAGGRVVTGRELTVMDDETLAATVASSNVYARVAPEHKMRIVGALKAQGQTVAMTGDGVNDAPALRAADIGVAMGITGTQVTKEAATMVLVDDNFATIVAAVREGRRIFDNIRKVLRYLLSSNMGEVLTVFGGVVLASVIGLSEHSTTGVVLPLVATQILWINLVTDSGPALAMGVDPSVEDVMARSPRRTTDRVVNGGMWAGVVLVGAVMAVATLMTLDFFLPGGLIENAYSTDDLDTARTAAFTTLVFAQLFNTFNSRSENVSAFSHVFVNRWLWGSIALGALLQVVVVHVPVFQAAFSTAPLDLMHWGVAIALGSLVLWVDELRKVVRRALKLGQ